MLKTKIICTLGPAVDNKEMMRKLIENGLDVVRMNFSHGSHEEQYNRLQTFRSVCKEMGERIPILLDTKGPEIRLGTFDEPVELITDQQYILTTQNISGDNLRACISYDGLPADVSPGERILIDDGLIELEIQSIEGDEIITRVLNGGTISSKKGVNVPGVSLRLPALTEQDKMDILFAIQNDYHFIAVSFVRKREDILEIARFLAEHDGGHIKLIAKIENKEGVDNLDEILQVSDGIMVARGDLGVEIPAEDVPFVQKDLIWRCYRAGKPVITATQMLDSMIRNPRPTRAEASDIANAILDGTSAIMLSGETASGKHPIEALQTMRRIAQTAEENVDYWKRFKSREPSDYATITNAIGHATCTTAQDLNAAAIVAVTTSGSTARRISSFRPSCPIIAATTSETVYHQLRLCWGAKPVLVDVVEDTDALFAVAMKAAKSTGVKDGEIIVITAGVPVGMSGTTNMLKVQMVGDMLCHGTGYGTARATGTICIWQGDYIKTFTRGCVLVLDTITDEVLPMIRQAAAVVLDGDDKEGKAQTLQMALEIPFLVNAAGAMKGLTNGTFVHVDAKKGSVERAG